MFTHFLSHDLFPANHMEVMMRNTITVAAINLSPTAWHLFEVSQRWNFPTTVFYGDVCLFLFNFSHLAFLLGSDAASQSQTSEEEGVIFVNSQDASIKTKKGECGKFAVHKNELSGFCQAEKQEGERACDSPGSQIAGGGCSWSLCSKNSIYSKLWIILNTIAAEM